MASAVFSASREVAGLLGITIIGVILRARQTAEVHLGRPAISAFLSGYRLGLIVAGILVSAGGIAAWLALRNLPVSEKSANEPRRVGASDALILATE